MLVFYQMHYFFNISLENEARNSRRRGRCMNQSSHTDLWKIKHKIGILTAVSQHSQSFVLQSQVTVGIKKIISLRNIGKSYPEYIIMLWIDQQDSSHLLLWWFHLISYVA